MKYVIKIDIIDKKKCSLVPYLFIVFSNSPIQH